jgi:hypothetical protein
MEVNTRPRNTRGAPRRARRRPAARRGTDERLELLGVMDPDEMRASLAFIVSMYPQVFDFALVRDRAMAERLGARLDEDQDDEEPYCSACGAAVGIFRGRGGAWLHYTGQGTADSPAELFDAGHEPVITWRLAPAFRRCEPGLVCGSVV